MYAVATVKSMIDRRMRWVRLCLRAIGVDGLRAPLRTATAVLTRTNGHDGDLRFHSPPQLCTSARQYARPKRRTIPQHLLSPPFPLHHPATAATATAERLSDI